MHYRRSRIKFVPVVILLILGILSSRDALTQEPRPAKQAPAAKRDARVDAYGDPLPPEVLCAWGRCATSLARAAAVWFFRADGKFVTASSEWFRPEVRLWDPASGRVVRDFKDIERSGINPAPGCDLAGYHADRGGRLLGRLGRGMSRRAGGFVFLADSTGSGRLRSLLTTRPCSCAMTTRCRSGMSRRVSKRTGRASPAIVLSGSRTISRSSDWADRAADQRFVSEYPAVRFTAGVNDCSTANSPFLWRSRRTTGSLLPSAVIIRLLCGIWPPGTR